MNKRLAPVGLIIPPSPFLADERVFVSLGILKVAACLERAGYPVEVLDLSGVENYEQVASAYLAQTDATFIGLTATTPQYPNATKLAERISQERPDVRLCLGGPHATAVNAAYKRECTEKVIGRAHTAFSHLLKTFHVVIAGDGEEAIFQAFQLDCPRLIDADDPDSALFLRSETLAEYPLPARHLIDLLSYKYSLDGEAACSLVCQLGCPYGCFGEHTLLGLPTGLIYPDEIIRTQVDICPEKHVHTLGMIGDCSIVYNGHKECVTITLESHSKLTLTPDHPVLCVEKEELVWKNAGSLTNKDYVAVRCGTNQIKEFVPLFPPSVGKNKEKRDIKTPAMLNEKVAWLMGYLIADGCIPSDGRSAITFATKARSEETLLSYLQDCFGFSGALYKSAHTDKMKNLWIYSGTIRRFFEESVGISNKDKLRVPLLIRKSPKSVVVAFIDGLMAGDGYFKKKSHPYLSTKSHEFAQEIVHLAEWIGWGASINFSMPDEKGHRHARILLCNDRCWDAKGGGHPCLTRSVPLNNRRIYRSIKSGKVYYRTATKHSPGATRALLAELNPDHPLLQGKFIYAKVAEVETSGSQRVFDLSVPGEHQFAASGINLHNCNFCGMRLSPSFRRVRLRSIQHVLMEIEHIYHTYGLRGFNFLDDELNVNKNLVADMRAFIQLQERLGVSFKCRGFIKSNLFTLEQAKAMYDAGFRTLLIGFEAGHPRILQNIKKQATVDQNTRCMEIADKVGLKVKALMSVGHPGESEETILAVHDWLLSVQPADFDVTAITVYPSTPYYDLAKPSSSKPGTWVYECPNGDRLYSYELDFSRDSSYYKGIPGDYRSTVFTDYLNCDELVQLRDLVEKNVREKLGIPYYRVTPSMKYESSMGQLPGYIYRSSGVSDVVV